MIQPKFTFTLKDRPRINLNRAMYQELHSLKRDYAIQVYFKENLQVGHKSRYTMGELANHLMVEGNYAKDYNPVGRKPYLWYVKRDRNGNAVIENGKYVLEIKKGQKKRWNFVANAAKIHHNWKKEIMNISSEILIRRLSRALLGKNISVVNFKSELTRLAKKIKNDIISAFDALTAPPLEPSTIKKKKKNKILEDTRKLINSMDVRVIEFKQTKSTFNIPFGRMYAKNNPKLSAAESAFVDAYIKAMTGSKKNKEGEGISKEDVSERLANFINAYRRTHGERSGDSEDALDRSESIDSHSRMNNRRMTDNDNNNDDDVMDVPDRFSFDR